MDSKQLNILLADDDPDDRDFFKQALEKLPLPTHLTTVSDGEQLMNYLSENSEQLPDVLFLDINMPRKNGFECLSEIKKSETLRDLPVIMLSTSFSQVAINMLFKIGTHVYIRKPGDITQLIQVIHDALPLSGKQIFSNSQIKYILNA